MKLNLQGFGWATVGAAVAACASFAAQPRAETPLAHVVVVELKEHTDAARDEFVKSCHKYLSGHEGTLYYAVGKFADDVVEPVSDRAFDVVIHLVFENKAAEQKYLKDPRHVKFVEENASKFAKVRVFDSYVTKPGGDS